ncbi:DNA-directed RNA polymerase subunit F [Halorubrum distributum JCM 9100]|uniref:DNA-directed RNA polymerase subunit Rpo4 n=6 Tax=Halorubrum distributum TaxID=29283 RepID=M0EPF4_9EURY|nr:MULTISPECIES: RNA polymerase Rpb4 family protein [Halorubrum distributum group]PHQ46479.1 DNA-directed RNA polymerase subunit F [Halorubrum sp. C3]ELZ32194.1 DNA-directed RNA polymerase subunit F [Halorubrum terrestre JCM 10247]ELZ49565.1 DNA-directed RNA polymerase subunit F [Halorubrum distributum JCM 9100]ELZ57135.1 DNA-directed RNA polymerase subunit F [Halorubrum distributum JCM 10118]EMA59020.1 DNA-directed RNA polymerase subunit F [Halorubrum litoreum JCM 13561]
MTIFKEKLDEEYVTTSEAKEILVEIEDERAEDEDRDLRYELARAIEHVNRFAKLDADESRELVEELAELDQIDVPTAVKITDLLPEDRTELRSVFAQERYSLDGEELDEILDVVAKYA